MNNEEKNTYVKKQITNALLALLEQHEFSEISISQITAYAKVSRNSFYRNYADKEDILLKYIRRLFLDWDAEYKKQSQGSNVNLYGSLFRHLSDNKEFYLLLKKRNLFHLFLAVLLEQAGPKSEYDNTWAYITAFIAYGTYGWIEEWVARGMQESGDEMAALLVSHGIQ
ncbi:MAG: TetR/AcrR family transcriptional regulator [Oscillospiraceae bacterium]|nr:TetR/AcrR family transcriptional regulator [Oscillospiraceae bacterium]